MTRQPAASGVPYYSQWESAGLVAEFVAGTVPAAQDPRWAESGAASPQEYEFWARRVCGLACLKMILAARSVPVPPMMRLVEHALHWGAYVRDGDSVAGLIYQPFADWVGAGFGVVAKVLPELPAALIESASPQAPVIASVHSWIRWPDRVPPARGGHLVLVTGMAGGLIRLHNPSGLPGVSQQDALISPAAFGRFFAGRGLLIAG
jgi:hypothetical protein